MRSFTAQHEKFKKSQDRFFENLKDQKKWSEHVRIKHELGEAGPNSLKTKISRGTLMRSKKIPVTLAKMSWDK